MLRGSIRQRLSPSHGPTRARGECTRRCLRHVVAAAGWPGGHSPVAVSTTSQFIPITVWMPALAVAKFVGTIVVSSLTGAFRMVLTYRTAQASPDQAGAWDPTGLGTPLTADGETNSGELTPTTTGKMWIQVGIKYELVSGSTPAQADVAVLVGVRSP